MGAAKSRSIRIDQRLVRDGLCADVEQAKRLIMAGSVRINRERATNASIKVKDEQDVSVEQPARFVSRGGDKLANGLADFSKQLAELGYRVSGAKAIDIGCAHGGFTDCLLQQGAEQVIAVDVGYGQLDQKLRNHSQVTVLERTNARHLSCDQLPYAPDLMVCDASFISLPMVIEAATKCMRRSGWWGILLCKPQFEAGRERMAKYGRKGVLVDPEMREQIRDETITALEQMGIRVLASAVARPRGPKGNVEYCLLVEG